MDIRSKLQELQDVDDNINVYHIRINELTKNPPNFYFMFCSVDKLSHDIHIARKCQNYWRRKWNRIVNELPNY
jgi:hypothetical protein